MTNVKRFPASAERRDRRNLNAGVVECQVSPRWLQFSKNATVVGEKGFMSVDVMTLSSDEQPRKICELVLAKEDLLAMLAAIEVSEVP